MIGIAGAKIMIEERKVDKEYAGTMNLGLERVDLKKSSPPPVKGIQFEMSLKIPSQEIDRRCMKARTPKEVDDVIKKNVLVSIKRADGTRPNFDSNGERDQANIYPFIYQAYGLLIDQIRKGGEHKLEIPILKLITEE